MKIFLVVVLLLGLTTFANALFPFVPGKPIDPKTLASLRKAELARLNIFRRTHKVGQVVPNPTLERAAQAYAQQLCRTKRFAHSPAAQSGKYGENLYTSSAYPFIKYLPGGATVSWQSEKSNYNFSTGKAINPRKMIGHFTAQVWKRVTSVGFGYCTTTKTVTSSSGKRIDLAVLYVVANYAPTPNVVGQYIQNVFKE